MKILFFMFFLLAMCCATSFAIVPPCYVLGDANGNGVVNISDPIFLNNYLFLGGPPPTCLAACDANSDGRVDVSDPVFMLNVLFGGQQPPPGWAVCANRSSALSCGTACCN